MVPEHHEVTKAPAETAAENQAERTDRSKKKRPMDYSMGPREATRLSDGEEEELDRAAKESRRASNYARRGARQN